MARREGSVRIAKVLLWLTALGTTIYWLAYFDGFRFSQGVECSRQLQVAQIPSNAWIVVSCCLGALGLRRKRRWGLLMTAAAASAGLYIGLLDITFNIQAGTYTLLPWGELTPELFANSVSTILPAFLFSVILRAPVWEQPAESAPFGSRRRPPSNKTLQLTAARLGWCAGSHGRRPPVGG